MNNLCQEPYLHYPIEPSQLLCKVGALLPPLLLRRKPRPITTKGLVKALEPVNAECIFGLQLGTPTSCVTWYCHVSLHGVLSDPPTILPLPSQYTGLPPVPHPDSAFVFCIALAFRLRPRPLAPLLSEASAEAEEILWLPCPYPLPAEAEAFTHLQLGSNPE